MNIALWIPWSLWPSAASGCVGFISPTFTINPAILSRKKVRRADVFIGALLIFREESKLSQDVCYRFYHLAHNESAHNLVFIVDSAL